MGLDGAAAQFDTGLGDRPGVPNLIIFITDGNDTLDNSLTDIENASLNTGAEVFAVGVGGDVSAATLDAIATDPNSGHVFTSGFSGLLDIVDDIVEATLAAGGQAFKVEGGTASSVSGGTIYDIESIAEDCTVIRSRVLLLPDGSTIVESIQID